MKKILVAFFLLFASVAGFAQCGKNVILTASKTEYLDAAMNVQHTVDEHTIITLRDSTVTITPGDDAHKMTGIIKSKSCIWTVPFKEGKSTVTTTITDENGRVKNLTITIEGNGGKLTFLAEIDEMPDRKIRVSVDTFEAEK